MRFNRSHAVATDFQGRAVASWLDDSTELYQQPQNPQQPDGPWLMVTRSGGTTQPFNPQGANQWFAREGQWVRRLDGANPQLIGSAAWLSNYPNAYAGDVDYDGTILVLSPDKLTMVAGDVSVRRSDVQGDTRLIHGLLCYTSLGVVKVYDLWNGAWLQTTQVGPGASWALAWRDAVGGIWLSYQTDAHGGVIHRISDASVGYKYGTPEQIYFPDVDFHGPGGRMGWSYNAGQFPSDWRFSEVWPVWGENMVPLTVPPVPVDPPIGPLSDPLPDGTVIDVASFFGHDDAFWPRGDTNRGDDHGMDLQVLPDGRLWYAKFADEGQGKLGEVLAVDAQYIHLLMDASNQTSVDVWPTDSRWLRTSMPIGRAAGLKTGIHQLEKRQRADCSLITSLDFEKENWVIAVWPQFYCGADLGVCEVMRYAYNNTGWDEGQTGSPTLWVETYYMARKLVNGVMKPVGWIGWTSDPSSEVFKTGTAVWPAKSALTKWFARFGGQRFPPNVPKCAFPPAIPPEVPVELPSDVVALLNRFALAFPPPQGTPGQVHDFNCRAWMAEWAAQCCYSFGPSYGHKATSAGAPPSKDVFARQRGSSLDGWDVLTGAGTGQPVLSNPPGYIDITGQAFLPVAARAHLGAPTSSGRPAPDLLGVGVSSFDLGEALDAGRGEAWLQMLQREGVTRPRVFLCRSGSAPTLAIAESRIANTLARLAAYGMKAEIVLLADTKIYGLTEADALDWVRRCVGYLAANPVGVGCVQGANEPIHSTQQVFVSNAAFMAQVAALVPLWFPYTAGPSTHGGGTFGDCSYLTTHGNRDRDAYANAAVSAQLSTDRQLPVIEDEPIGIDAVARPGSRTNDPAYGYQLADACRAVGIGATLHLDSGLRCDVNTLDAIELDALRRFVTRMKAGTGPVPVPHKILDAPLSPGLPTGYVFWVNNWPELAKEAESWYERAYGRRPAPSDVGHGLWRAIYEGDRWLTARNAFANTWPGGEP